ncbi:hypothetical protein GF360_00925 [candidate division WWE3 bacterium]|nr:hypothetical protein [candidate division WWE3 bacterium]
MKKVLSFVLIVFLGTLGVFAGIFTGEVAAQEDPGNPREICIGENLAEYVNGVKMAARGCYVPPAEGDLGGLGGFTNWRFSGENAAAAENYLKNRAEIVVLYENFGPASVISGLTVGRFLGEETITESIINSVYGQVAQKIEEAGDVNVWQGYNEPITRMDGEPSEYWEKVARHDIEVIKATRDNGRAACIGNFKETVTAEQMTQQYVDMITNEISANGGNVYLCLHSHWNSAGMMNSEAARVNSLGAKLNLPVLVTVAGYDSKAGENESHGDGWKGILDAATYKQQLLDYKSSVNAAGVSVFSLGLGGWEGYDIADLLEVGAPAPDPESCDGEDLQHIQLLSPAFNMTNLFSATIANTMVQTDPTIFDGLAGLAGNSYNTDYGTATGLVNSWMSVTGLNNYPLMITETGTTVAGDWANLQPELACLGGGSCGGVDYMGASIFNVFNNNPGWEEFSYQGGNIVADVCGGNCSGLGANFAGGLADATPAADAGMSYVVGIVGTTGNPSDAVGPATYINGLPPGIIPILRIGTALDRDGPSAAEFGAFVAALDNLVEREVYMLAGPNEPLSECWWDTSGECYDEDCGEAYLETKVPRTIIGKITSSYLERDENGVERTELPVSGASICVYQGGGSEDRLPYYLTGFEANAQTDAQGMFAVNSWLRFREEEDVGEGDYIGNYTSPGGQYNYLGILCGDTIQEVIKVDMDFVWRGEPLPARYENIVGNVDADVNTTVLYPIELTVSCDPDSAGASFPDTIEYPHNPDEPHNYTDPEAGYAGWDFAARHHITGEITNSCPQFLPYTDRRDGRAVAYGGGSIDDVSYVNPTQDTTGARVLLSQVDERENPPRITILQEEDQLEGKGAMQNSGDSLPTSILKVMHLLTGGLLNGPKPLPLNPEGDGLYNLPTCELLRLGHQQYAPGEDVNSQRAHGILSNLANPYTEDEGGLKDLYTKMDKSTDVCCLKSNPEEEKYDDCNARDPVVELSEIQPYRHFIDPENWCNLEECESSETGWCPLEGETCQYKLPNEYFPEGTVRTQSTKTDGALKLSSEQFEGDSLTTCETCRRDKWAFSGGTGVGGEAIQYDPINDLPGDRGECPVGGKCGGQIGGLNSGPKAGGLASPYALKALADTQDYVPSSEEDRDWVQNPISILEPYTGWENQEEPAFVNSGHTIVRATHTKDFTVLDGHRERPLKIGPVPKEGGEAINGDPPPGDIFGYYEAAYDVQLECTNNVCDDYQASAPAFYGVTYLNPAEILQNAFTDVMRLLSVFWGEDEEPMEKCRPGTGEPVQVPCEPSEEDPACTCDEEGNCTKEEIPPTLNCSDTVGIELNYEVGLQSPVNVNQAFENVFKMSQAFQPPPGMSTVTKIGGGMTADSQADYEQTQNNEEGFGGQAESFKNGADIAVDQLREMVRPYTSTYNAL